MTLHKSRILSTTLLLGLSAFAEEAAGPQVEFSGMIDADVVGTYDSDAKDMVYQANHEADLVATVKISDKAAISLGMTSTTAGVTPGGGTPANDASHWASVIFDGVWANYEFNNGLNLLAGDFALTEGAFSYYGYKRTRVYASVMPENYFRGAGFDFKGASLYAGADDASSDAEIYAAYNLEVGSFGLKPFALYNTGSNIRAGLSASGSIGEHSLSFTYGALKDDGLDMTNTFKLEGALSLGKVSVYGTAYYSILGDNPTIVAAAPIVGDTTGATNPLEEGFFYIEPDYAFSDLISAGPALEFHLGQKDIDDSWVGVYPNLYITPSSNLQFIFWGGTAIPVGQDDADPVFAAGSEIIASF